MKHKKILFGVFLFAIVTTSLPNTVVAYDYVCADKCRMHIEEIKKALKTSKEEVAKHIAFPLERDYPLPPVFTAEQFLTQYDEIFDEALILSILNSKHEDWHAIGWRGVLLRGRYSPYKSGILWMTYDGQIRSVIYHSDYEKIKRKYLIEHKKEKIHSSARNYVEPILNWETKNFFIRVDKLENKDYRYVAWKKPKQQQDVPSLILKGGTMFFHGTSNPDGFRFKNGKYYYVLFPNWSYKNGLLRVYKDEKNRTHCKDEKGFAFPINEGVGFPNDERAPCLLASEEVLKSN